MLLAASPSQVRLAEQDTDWEKRGFLHDLDLSFSPPFRVGRRHPGTGLTHQRTRAFGVGQSLCFS